MPTMTEKMEKIGDPGLEITQKIIEMVRIERKNEPILESRPTLEKVCNKKVKPRTKSFDCIMDIWLVMCIGSALEEPPKWKIDKVARLSEHSWEVTRNILDLLYVLGNVNREGEGLKKTYQYRPLVDKFDVPEQEIKEHGALERFYYE